jgi:hypothetical protein
LLSQEMRRQQENLCHPLMNVAIWDGWGIRLPKGARVALKCLTPPCALLRVDLHTWRLIHIPLHTLYKGQNASLLFKCSKCDHVSCNLSNLCLCHAGYIIYRTQDSSVLPIQSRWSH